MGDTLVVGKIVDNSQATNPKQTRKKSKNILRMVAISTIFLMLFGVFSYLGANLAKKYFVVPETIVPNVIGLTEEEAKQKIEAKKLKYNVIGRVFDISPAGQVIDQEPKGDRKVKINHPSIDLVISKGQNLV